jgi:hypothetical protein
MAGSEYQPEDGPMNYLRAFRPLVSRHRGLVGLIVMTLPLVLAACTNASGSGTGY